MISYLKLQLKVVPHLQHLRDLTIKYERATKIAKILGIALILIGGFLLLHVEIQNFFNRTAGYSSEVTEISPARYVFKTSPSQVLGIEVTSKIGFIDKRAYVLDQYFKAGNSPLYGTGKIFVAACDKYGAPKDCTTVAAIARAETDLCKYANSAEYHNCWGFGGGGTDRIKFNSWDESITLVTDRLVNTYGEKYILDPSLMEKVFCGSEPGCTNWGTRVKFYMNQISEYAKVLGFDKTLFELR